MTQSLVSQTVAALRRILLDLSHIHVMSLSTMTVVVFTQKLVADGLSLALNLLSPAYVLLSVTVLISRHVKLLGTLASHGKTRTTTTTTTTSTTTTTTTTTTTGNNNSYLEYFWISKRYFGHFYIVGLSSWLFLRLIVYYNIMNNSKDALSFHLTDALLLIHLMRRCYESYYVQKPSASSKMHILGYLLGVGHYLVLPLVFLRFEAMDPPTGITTSSESTRLATMISSLLLCVANLVFQNEQFQHHRILASLRQDGKNISSTTRQAYYSVPPKKRWFSYILCPHYLAEILIYLTWALLLELDIRQQDYQQQEQEIFSLLSATRNRHWFLFVWVATNLTVSSLNSFDWYSSKYTTTSLGQRTALIPYWL